MEQVAGIEQPRVRARAFFRIGERMFGQVPAPELLMARRMPLVIGLGTARLYRIRWLGNTKHKTPDQDLGLRFSSTCCAGLDRRLH